MLQKYCTKTKHIKQPYSKHQEANIWFHFFPKVNLTFHSDIIYTIIHYIHILDCYLQIYIFEHKLYKNWIIIRIKPYKMLNVLRFIFNEQLEHYNMILQL